jgi:predicted hotdog family 3-hydroxylacyl-ACP dehydratase
MCLLDEVLMWDLARIRCRSSTHRSAANPLRAQGRLGAACGIEYAAQAMAVHGALIASRTESSTGADTAPAAPLETAGPRVVGYLASVRNVTLFVSRLDDLGGDLIATAELVTGDASTVLYNFSIHSGARPLVEGRATIVFTRAFGALLTQPHPV